MEYNFLLSQNNIYNNYDGYIYENGKWKPLKFYIFPKTAQFNTWNTIKMYPYNNFTNKTWIQLREEIL